MAFFTHTARHRLQEELRNTHPSQRRPVLTNLNGDNAWLISIPRPPGQTEGGKCYFHILVDPWLRGPAIDIASWFSIATHLERGIYEHISQVEGLITEIESPKSGNCQDQAFSPILRLDAVLISHQFADHMSKASLDEVSSDVPVFAVPGAASVIRSWKHFDTVVDLRDFDPAESSWRHTWTNPLPDWLTFLRLSAYEFFPALHYGILVAFSKGNPSDPPEAILYSPHGIEPQYVEGIMNSKPPIRMLALLHGMDEPRVLHVNVLGATNALKLENITGAKYWLRTHNPNADLHGFVGLFLWDVKRTVEYGIQQILHETGATHTSPNFFDLGNGNSVILR